jgi:hypothetical protein
MRLAWRAHYDFGRLTAELSDDRIRFKVEEYDDIPMVHALMTVGWGIGAARSAGAKGAALEIIARPWQGGAGLEYDIRI